MSTFPPLQIATIGVGHLGRHHARILSSMPGTTLVAVVDINAKRAAEIAASAGTTALADAASLVGRVDAVTIAAPTDVHLQLARPFLERGVAVLVEKPMTRSVAEAEAMIAAARKSGSVLAVGQTERFNPAVEAVRSDVHDPRFIEIHRLGTFPERSLDIDVVFDLMIHDLDIVLSFVGDGVDSVQAVGVPVLTGRVDIANARLVFASGCVANVTASRISRDRVRKVRFFQRDAYISVDYGSQEAEMFRLVRHEGARPTIEGGKVEVRRDEPLRLELADFVDAARTGRRPLVTGEDGRSAVALAERIVSAMSSVV